MIRAVLDVNVIVSGVPASSGAPSELIDRWLAREYEVVLSEHILEGTFRAWNNRYFRSRYPHDEPQRAVDLLRKRATMVSPLADVPQVTQDREDDLVLATALAGDAAFLVTGDLRFCAIGHYLTVTMLAPREFLTLLQAQTPR